MLHNCTDTRKQGFGNNTRCSGA